MSTGPDPLRGPIPRPPARTGRPPGPPPDGAAVSAPIAGAPVPGERATPVAVMTAEPEPSTTSTVLRAAGDALPVILAYVPFALTLGTTLAASGLSPLVAWSSSPLMFGGAAQLLAVQLLGAGANAAVVVAGALVVNSRMLLYSASLAPHAAGWPRRWRWAGAYLLADPVYALAIGRFGRPDGGGSARGRLVYYVAVGMTLWTAWLLLTGAGVLLAGVLPASLRLDVAAPLTFLLLVLPMLTSKPAYAAASVGGLVAVAASGLPLGLGLLVGAAAGIAAGATVAGRVAVSQAGGPIDRSGGTIRAKIFSTRAGRDG